MNTLEYRRLFLKKKENYFTKRPTGGTATVKDNLIIITTEKSMQHFKFLDMN